MFPSARLGVVGSVVPPFRSAVIVPAVRYWPSLIHAAGRTSDGLAGFASDMGSPPQISDAALVTVVRCCDAWKTRHSPTPVTLGSRRACGLNRQGPANAHDLWLVHNDDEVSYRYDNEKLSLEQAGRRAKFMGESWRVHGAHNWIA